MYLADFPDAIAHAQTQKQAARLMVENLEGRVTRAEARVDHAIAFDTDLKNDGQRKAKRAELLETEEFEKLHAALHAARGVVIETEIELGLLLNQFSVAKLEERRAIATLELQAAR